MNECLSRSDLPQKTAPRTEVRICGVGGQGVVLAGNLLALAAHYEHPFACSSATYGPETRGTVTRSEVVISGEWIDFPQAIRPRFLLVFAQKAYDACSSDMSRDGMVFYDSSLVQPAGGASIEHMAVPAFDIARRQLDDSASANMVMLGHFARKTGLVSMDALVRAAAELFGARGADRASRALQAKRLA
jgi:2-oxoglutarate ferredoxin oxidoreductase subunit gamma